MRRERVRGPPACDVHDDGRSDVVAVPTACSRRPVCSIFGIPKGPPTPTDSHSLSLCTITFCDKMSLQRVYKLVGLARFVSTQIQETRLRRVKNGSEGTLCNSFSLWISTTSHSAQARGLGVQCKTNRSTLHRSKTESAIDNTETQSQLSKARALPRSDPD